MPEGPTCQVVRGSLTNQFLISSMAFSDDVDICVTCVTNKPPRLPLREELVSLGVEVIYKASGVGARAAQKESKRAVKDLRKIAKENKRKYRLWPKSRKEKYEKERQQKMLEKEVYKNRTSISYDAYNQRLHRTESGDSSSLGSLSSLSNLGGRETAAAKGDHRASLLEDRDGTPVDMDQDDARDQPFHEAFAKGAAGGVNVAALSFASPSGSKYSRDGPLSAATSPTMSYTSFGMEDTMVSPGNDDGSDSSTFEKKHDIDKPLVSATGERWWYPSQNGFGGDPTQAPRPSGQKTLSQSYSAPPPLPSLDAETRDKAPTEQESEEAEPWMPCGFSRICGGGLKVVDEGDNKVDVDAANTTTERIDNVYSQESMNQYDLRDTNNAMVKDFAIVRSYEDEGNDTIMDDRSADEEEDGGIESKVQLPPVPLTPKPSYLQSKGPLNSQYSCDSRGSRLSYLQSKSSLNSPYSCDSRGSRGEYEDGAVCISKSDFVAMVSNPDADALKIKEVLRISPTLARARMRQDGRLPLHVVCDRPLPDRFERNVSLADVLDSLIDDIIQWREVVAAVLLFNADAGKVIDKQADLPLHLAARRLVEWEGQWSAKLGGDWGMDQADAVKINDLRDEMIQAIEILIDPILETRGLCRKRGSLGRILPLHIACIFPISLEKMRTLLQTYPEAAGVPCDLGDLLTLVTNYSLPLELLHGEKVSNDSERQCKSVDDSLSDLVFSLHPNVDPYRLDPERLTRLEAVIKKAAKGLHQKRGFDTKAKMEVCAQSAWTWFCTFDESAEGKTFDYSNNVKNIVYALELGDVSILAEEKTYTGTILTLATPACAAIIKARLTGRAMNDIPNAYSIIEHVEQPLLSTQISLSGASCASSLTGVGSIGKRFSKEAPVPDIPALKRRLQKEPSLKLPSFEPRSVGTFTGALMKKVFNVRENSHPTSFIILPYKLVKGGDGSLTLDTPEAAPVAVKFAKYLLEMTQPTFLKHQLEKKSIQRSSYKLPVNEMEEWTLTEEKNRNIIREMLDIYRSGPAYLYLLDEKDGIPIVDGQEAEKYYPIRMEDPFENVKRMLPLMLMGMIHMRGDKSLSVLVRAIMEGGLSVPETWVQTAQGALELLYADSDNHTSVISAALSCKKDLVNFVCSINQDSSRCREITEDGYEWVVELTLLKLMLERSDIRRSFAGLKPVDVGDGETIWTRFDIDAVSSEPPHQMSRDSELPHQMSRDSELSGKIHQDSEPLHQMSNQSEVSQLMSPESTEMSHQMSRDSADQMQSCTNSFDLESVLGTQSMASADTRTLDNLLSDETSPPKNLLPPRSSRVLGRSQSIGARSRASSVDEKYLPRSRAGSCDGRSIVGSLTHSCDSSVSSFAQSRCDSADLRQSGSWRDQLEREEAKLDEIRARLSTLDLADEETMSLRGEKLMDDLSQELNEYEASLTGARRCDAQEQEENYGDIDIDEDDIDDTTKLLMRLCNLEERLLSREIDLQQIKLDLHNFELDAVGNSAEWAMTTDD
jgi:hypothetical protein